MSHPLIFTVLAVIVIAVGLHIDERWQKKAKQDSQQRRKKP